MYCVLKAVACWIVILLLCLDVLYRGIYKTLMILVGKLNYCKNKQAKRKHESIHKLLKNSREIFLLRNCPFYSITNQRT